MKTRMIHLILVVILFAGFAGFAGQYSFAATRKVKPAASKTTKAKTRQISKQNTKPNASPKAQQNTKPKAKLNTKLCQTLLSQESAEIIDVTDSLIAYMTSLLESQVIKDEGLSSLIAGAKNGALENPITEAETLVNSAALIHSQEIQDYFNSGLINQEKILHWAVSAFKKRNQENESREIVKQETKDPYQKMEFITVPPGEFVMGNENGFPLEVDVKLTHEFEVMSTLVTQKMWVDLMGQNPAHFADGEHAITVNVNGNLIKMQPDNPVENITWWAAAEFANRLSEKHGLKPVYDLRFEGRESTSAEAGTLMPIAGPHRKRKHRVNAPDNDIYQAEGYRLSTEAENEYLLRNLGQTKGDYPHGISDKMIMHYAWFEDNSDDTTHPVGTTPKSFIINNKEIYDLVGNVRVWTSDLYAKNVKGGINPRGAEQSDERVVRSGSWDGSGHRLAKNELSPFFRFSESPDIRYEGLGFRLVRTIK